MSQCSPRAKIELFKSTVLQSNSGVAYSPNCIQLMASSKNISTNDLLQVIMLRASDFGEKAALGIVADLNRLPSQDLLPAALPINSSDSDDVSEESIVVTTKLVWIDENAATSNAYKDFSVADTFILLENLAEEKQMPYKMAEIEQQLKHVDEIMNQTADGDTEGEARTRHFIRWASQIIGSANENDYAFKVHSDALIIHRFIDHMNDNYQSLTLAQYELIKTSILAKFNEYGTTRKLQMSRFNVEWTETSTGEIEAYWINDDA